MAYRLTAARIHSDLTGSRDLEICYVQNGANNNFFVPLDVDWDTWTREEKIAWVRQELDDYIVQSKIVMAGNFYPDGDPPIIAKNDIENMPGWASWTAQEANDWIEVNVVDLASAKTVLKSIARMVVHLRDIGVER